MAASTASEIVPKAVIDDIRRGGNQELFKKGAGYRCAAGRQLSQHVVGVAKRARRILRARPSWTGVLYIKLKAEMVIAHFASHHQAANKSGTTFPAYQAVAERLMATR